MPPTINPLLANLGEIKISELEVAAQANDSDQLEANQAGVTRSITVAQVAARTDLSLYAPLASPTFTGDPKAPTPLTADNDTSVATTAYVKAQGYAVAANYLPLAGGTLTGTLNGTIGNWNGKQTVTAVDDAQAMLLRGVSKGVRFSPTTTEFAIEGVDNTGSGSFQPLRVSGSELRFGVPGETMRLSATGLGIGVMPSLTKLHVFGAGGVLANPSPTANLAGTIYAQDSGVGVGNGGMVMFGAGQGPFAAIKGHILSGTGPVGDLIVSTRKLGADTTLTEAMRWKIDGSTVLSGALTGTIGNFNSLSIAGNIATANAAFVYTPYNGVTNTGLVRAGFQLDGTNQGITVYTANTARGGWDASGNLTNLTQSPGDNTTKVATTAFVTAAITAGQPNLAPYALLASPTFTGNPTAPTPAPGDNDTSLATTAFVTAAVTAGQPNLAPYALLASPTFTGDPKAPTPATADNDTSIATTAYVKANLAALPAGTTIAGHLYGCTLSYTGAWGVVFAAGQFTDSTNVATASFTGITKLLNATWVAGSGNGGRGPGVAAPTALAFYHCFVAIISGVSEAFFDTSITGANAPAGTTYKRRVGSVIVESPGGANIYPFVQYDDDFRWVNQIQITATFPTSPSLLAAYTPPGVRTQFVGILTSQAASGNTVAYYLADDGQTPAYATFYIGSVGAATQAVGGGVFTSWTNLTSQIKYQHTGSGSTISIAAMGYKDPRGRTGGP